MQNQLTNIKVLGGCREISNRNWNGCTKNWGFCKGLRSVAPALDSMFSWLGYSIQVYFLRRQKNYLQGIACSRVSYLLYALAVAYDLGVIIIYFGNRFVLILELWFTLLLLLRVIIFFNWVEVSSWAVIWETQRGLTDIWLGFLICWTR